MMGCISLFSNAVFKSEWSGKDEWNAAVAKAQELVAQSGRGELSDEELKQKLEELWNAKLYLWRRWCSLFREKGLQ